MNTKGTNRKNIIKAIKKKIEAKTAFSDMVKGKITKEEFERMGFKLVKLG